MTPVPMYVVVTVFDPANGKRRITHAWGTYASRAEAAAEARRMKKQDEDDLRPGVITYHVCEVLGEEPK